MSRRHPGPWVNGFVKSCHDRFRNSCLNREPFANVKAARAVIEDWRDYYDYERLHFALGYKTPAGLFATFRKAAEPILSS